MPYGYELKEKRLFEGLSQHYNENFKKSLDEQETIIVQSEKSITRPSSARANERMEDIEEERKSFEADDAMQGRKNAIIKE